MKKVPVSVWIMALILVGVLALIGLTLASKQQAFSNVQLPVEITEYFDYQCPHCAEFYPTMKQLSEKYGSNVKITYKQYPFLNNSSYEFAYAAVAAGKQGKFDEFHDAIFSVYDKILNNQAQSEDMDVTKIAQSIPGLDIDKFNTDRASTEVQAEVQAQKAEGAKIGVTSTPTVFVYGQKVEIGKVNTATNQVEYTVFTDLIDQLIQKASANPVSSAK